MRGEVWLGLILVASVAVAKTPVLTCPRGDGSEANLRTNTGDKLFWVDVEQGSSQLVYHAKFDDTVQRSPNSLSGSELDVPVFYGGYLFFSENGANSSFAPQIFRLVRAPSLGLGYVSIEVTTQSRRGSSGTITNTLLGAFTTNTAIADTGEFRARLIEISNPLVGAGGATVNLRGAAFDGERWLVTAASSQVTDFTKDHLLISTREGWRELNTDDFTFGDVAVEPAGAFTKSGIWFDAVETASPDDIGFVFLLSDTYFTERTAPAAHSADTDSSGDINLSELLRVIELYNVRQGSQRTGRYAVDGEGVDGFAPDVEQAADRIAFFDAYHSADSNRDGSISLSELLRVIELYNTRSGTQRTGRFVLDASTDDGFAPDPGV